MTLLTFETINLYFIERLFLLERGLGWIQDSRCHNVMSLKETLKSSLQRLVVMFAEVDHSLFVSPVKEPGGNECCVKE